MIAWKHWDRGMAALSWLWWNLLVPAVWRIYTLHESDLNLGAKLNVAVIEEVLPEENGHGDPQVCGAIGVHTVELRSETCCENKLQLFFPKEKQLD